MHHRCRPPIPEGYEEVFTQHITLRNGRRLYARDVGKKAFRFLVKSR